MFEGKRGGRVLGARNKRTGAMLQLAEAGGDLCRLRAALSMEELRKTVDAPMMMQEADASIRLMRWSFFRTSSGRWNEPKQWMWCRMKTLIDWDRNGWTPERRAKQREAIRRWKPWEKSTGPRTPLGKAESARNGFHATWTGLAARNYSAFLSASDRTNAGHCFIRA